MTAGTASDDPTGTSATVEVRLSTRGPFSLQRVAQMSFGYRNEPAFDGVMRLAFCVDGGYTDQAGVEVRQEGDELALRVHGGADAAAVARQVARVVSVDADGVAFAELCRRDEALRRLHRAADGLRPALFYSPYEAALWSVLSARRPRPQGILLRERLNRELGAVFELAGVETTAAPTPSALLSLDGLPGLPADRVPRLHAVAEAAQQGLLEAAHLQALGPEAAMVELQRLPGIGPFYSALIVIRATGFTDVLVADEPRSRAALEHLYGRTGLDSAAYEQLAGTWRPFRTWVAVLARASGVGDPDVAG